MLRMMFVLHDVRLNHAPSNLYDVWASHPPHFMNPAPLASLATDLIGANCARRKAEFVEPRRQSFGVGDSPAPFDLVVAYAVDRVDVRFSRDCT